MNKQDPKSKLMASTVYVVIIIFAVVYKNWETGSSISKTSIALFATAGAFMIYNWIMYFKNKT